MATDDTAFRCEYVLFNNAPDEQRSISRPAKAALIPSPPDQSWVTDRLSVLTIILFCQSVTTCFALTPEQIIVVANKRARYSVELAKYYMKLRNIPSDNLVNIKAPEEEVCSREDYDKKIASPVKTFLKEE